MAETLPNPMPWKDALDPRSWTSPSALFLLAVNLIPLFGVLFAGWDLFLLMMLYWMETGIIGFWHLLKLGVEAKWFSLFLVPFFTVHFGGFMAGHFLFLWMLFGRDYHARIHNPGDFLSVIVFGSGLWLPLGALFLSHGFSLYFNTWKVSGMGGEGTVQTTMADPVSGLLAPVLPPAVAKAKNMQDVMTAPYRRIVVMHLTILFGAMLSMAFGTNKVTFALMVLLKTLADVASHVRKHTPGTGTGTESPA